jgi:hypothetical protein
VDTRFQYSVLWYCRACGDYTCIRRVLDWQLDLLNTLTVTLNYSVYTLQLTVHYTRAESSHLCLHWLPVFQNRRTCSPSGPTATALLTEPTELTVLCSVTHLYSRGTWLRLLLRHSRNTLRDVYRAAAAHASAILFAAAHSTVAWLPSNCCKQTPYFLQHARHNIISSVSDTSKLILGYLTKLWILRLCSVGWYLHWPEFDYGTKSMLRDSDWKFHLSEGIIQLPDIRR